MAALTTNVVPLTGLQIDTLLGAATSGGDDCTTGAGTFLLVKNGDASSHTVTLATPQVVDGLALADRTVTVAAGHQTAIPVTDRYRDPSTGRCAITYDAVTSVTVAVIRVAAS